MNSINVSAIIIVCALFLFDAFLHRLTQDWYTPVKRLIFNICSTLEHQNEFIFLLLRLKQTWINGCSVSVLSVAWKSTLKKVCLFSYFFFFFNSLIYYILSLKYVDNVMFINNYDQNLYLTHKPCIIQSFEIKDTPNICYAKNQNIQLYQILKTFWMNFKIFGQTKLKVYF